MLNLKILETEVQNFIQEHLNHNLAELSLKGSPFEGIKTSELMNQIQGKLKCKKKLQLKKRLFCMGVPHLGFGVIHKMIFP